MEFVHEVTAYLENKPGRLAKICSALAHEKIDIRALSVMETADRSVLRFVTDDLEPTKTVLTSLGTEFEWPRSSRSRWRTAPGPWPGCWSGSPRSTSTSNTPTSRPLTEPGRCLGIFHTSNPKRALPDPSGSDAPRATALDRAGGRRPLHTR